MVKILTACWLSLGCAVLTAASDLPSSPVAPIPVLGEPAPFQVEQAQPVEQPQRERLPARRPAPAQIAAEPTPVEPVDLVPLAPLPALSVEPVEPTIETAPAPFVDPEPPVITESLAAPKLPAPSVGPAAPRTRTLSPRLQAQNEAVPGLAPLDPLPAPAVLPDPAVLPAPAGATAPPPLAVPYSPQPTPYALPAEQSDFLPGYPGETVEEPAVFYPGATTIELYPSRERRPFNKHPDAVTRIVAVRCPTDHSQTVYVEICTPPCDEKFVRCSRRGDWVRYDFGKFEVTVYSRYGRVTVDYSR